MKELIKKLGDQVKSGNLTWREAVEEFNKQQNMNLTPNALRKRYDNLSNGESYNEEKTDEEYETHYQSGVIELQKEVWFDSDEEKTPENVLKKFGYDPHQWTLIEWRFGKWEVAIKSEAQNRICTTIRAKVKPKTKEIDEKIAMQAIKEIMAENIQPQKFEKKEPNEELNKNRLMEIPAIELHLGKMAWGGDTGQDYDKDIAIQRFNTITERIISKQAIEKCDRAVMCIGNDFFNSDTVDMATTRGTPQQNDLRWKKLFGIGLRLYVEQILLLREVFNHIDLLLVQGNHDNMASFYLYTALQQRFREDDKVDFREDTKETQCYTFGKCALFYNHGDINLKRLIGSLPAEFPKEWGNSVYRELHIQHLHSEQEIILKDFGGIIPRRIGSPSGTDAWHYKERFVGAQQKHQLFIWDKNNGLNNIDFIGFPNTSKKKVLKLRKPNNKVYKQTTKIEE